ncbi:MAG TPA: hypothetical protein VFJ21_11675 [Mycobacteriales bacterium]|jgi:hypothetical protein|nr:hypothetical protein [Mycobacteriales bacterium]
MTNRATSAAAAASRLPLQRCCTTHPDWQTLTQHLMVKFDNLDGQRVIDAVGNARQAVDLGALDPDDALTTGEIIARYQLLMLSDAAAARHRALTTATVARTDSAPGRALANSSPP